MQLDSTFHHTTADSYLYPLRNYSSWLSLEAAFWGGVGGSRPISWGWAFHSVMLSFPDYKHSQGVTIGPSLKRSSWGGKKITLFFSSRELHESWRKRDSQARTAESFLFFLSASCWVPLCSRQLSGVDFYLPVFREVPAGGSYTPVPTCHHKVGRSTIGVLPLRVEGYNASKAIFMFWMSSKGLYTLSGT